MSKFLVLLGVLSLACGCLWGCGAGSDATSTPRSISKPPEVPTTPVQKQTPTPPSTGNGDNPDTALPTKVCNQRACVHVRALSGWKVTPKTAADQQMLPVISYYRDFGTDCRLVFEVSIPFQNPPPAAKLAAHFTPVGTDRKSAPKPPPFRPVGHSVYMQRLAQHSTGYSSPLTQNGVWYTHKYGHSYAVLASMALGAPAGSSGSCTADEVASAKQQITPDLIAYLRDTTI